MMGWTNLENGPEKLGKLTNDEGAMVSVQLVVCKIDKGLMGINDSVKAVYDMVQTLGESCLVCHLAKMARQLQRKKY